MTAGTWVCHRWRGHGDQLTKARDDDRRNPNVALPPLITSGWPDKPHELRVCICTTADDAVAWNQSEVAAIGPTIAEPDGWQRFTESCERYRDRLTAFRPVTISFWLTDGSRLDLNILPTRSVERA